MQKRDLCWKKDNCPRLKNAMERLRNPTVDGFCDYGYLELGKYPIPQMTVSSCLKSIVNRTITNKNSFPARNWVLLS